MLRLNEIALPLDHDEAALERAILDRLGARPRDVEEYFVRREAIDARKTGAIRVVYVIDVAVKNEAAFRARHPAAACVEAPDLEYRPVTPGTERAAASAGGRGQRPGRAVRRPRARAHGLPPAAARARPAGRRASPRHRPVLVHRAALHRVEPALRRGGRGHLLRRQAGHDDPRPARAARCSRNSSRPARPTRSSSRPSRTWEATACRRW